MSAHAEKLAKEIVTHVLSSEDAPAIFGKTDAQFKKWHGSEKSENVMLALIEQIKQELEQSDIVKLLQQLDDYAFLLPKKERDEALALYKEAQAVQVNILKTPTEDNVSVLVPPVELKKRAEIPLLRPDEVGKSIIEQVGQSDVPDALGMIDTQAPELGRSGISILLPTSRDYNAHVLYSIIAQWKEAMKLTNGNVRLMIEKDTVIDRARNILASRFLNETDHEWSFWQDSDIIAPIGQGGWFKARTGSKLGVDKFAIVALNRLTAGPEKLVGAVYAERGHSGRLICQPSLHPRNDDDKHLVERLKQGPREERHRVGWLGFGCVAVHRQVFLDIQKRFPELAPKEGDTVWNFFSGMKASEDALFGQRAAEAGHAAYLDASVFCAHIGTSAFMP